MSIRHTPLWLLVLPLLVACLMAIPAASQAQRGAQQQRSYAPPQPAYTAPRQTYTPSRSTYSPQRPSYQPTAPSSYRNASPQFSQGTSKLYGTGSVNNLRGRVANDNVKPNLFNNNRAGSTGSVLFKNSAANSNLAPRNSLFKYTGGSPTTRTSMPRNNPFAAAGQAGQFKSAANDSARGSTLFKTAPRNSISHSAPPPGSALARQGPLSGLFNAHASSKGSGGSKGGGGGGGNDDGGGGGDDGDPPPSQDLKPTLISRDPGF